MDNLALMLQYQGKYKEAEKLSRQALEGYEKELGVHHTDTGNVFHQSSGNTSPRVTPKTHHK
jgi:hypothetical protein